MKPGTPIDEKPVTRAFYNQPPGPAVAERDSLTSRGTKERGAGGGENRTVSRHVAPLTLMDIVILLLLIDY